MIQIASKHSMQKIQQPIIFCLLIFFLLLAIFRPPHNFYPVINIAIPDQSGALNIYFLFKSRSTLQECETLNGKITLEFLSKCPQCRVTVFQCPSSLNDAQQILLSTASLPTPSGRMANGVVVFEHPNQDVALNACQVSESQSAKGMNPIKCFNTNTPRPQSTTHLFIQYWLWAIIFAAFAAAWITGWLIIRFEKLHAHLSYDQITNSPQKIHTIPTPRIGGLTLMIGMLIAGGVMIFPDSLPNSREYGLLLLAGIPAFFGGLVEDITKKVSVLDRLLLTMLSGVIAAWILGATLNRLDIPGADLFFKWLPFAVVFTSFAVSGVANAINIIDGFNGLATGLSIIMTIPLAYVAYQVNDSLVFTVAIALIGALLGFLVWNWPSGKIFMGDGGAYLLGFLLAELCVLLVVRNSNVTPWLPLLIFIHPIFETLFSIYRRIFLRGHSPGRPDALHLHTLIYKRIVPRVSSSGKTYSKHERNNRVAKFIWTPIAILAIYAMIFWESIPAMIMGAVAYCIFYCSVFRGIIKWKHAGSLSSFIFPTSRNVMRNK